MTGAYYITQKGVTMRSTVSLLVGIFLFVVSAALTIVWFSQAAAVKNAVETALARASEGSIKITHASIETSGFPGELVVTIRNPRISGRVDEWLAAYVPTKTPRPAWQENFVQEGDIQLAVNWLSSRYTLRMNGPWTSNAQIGDKAISLRSKGGATTNLTCQLDLSAGNLWSVRVWDFSKFLDKPESLLNDFRALDCYVPTHAVTDAKTGRDAITMGDQRLYITHQPAGDTTSARFYVSSHGSQIMPEGDAIINIYASALAMDGLNDVSYSAYGKETVEIDFSYHGPSSLDQGGLNSPISAELSKFTIQNQLYQSEARLSVTNKPTGENHDARLTLHIDSTYQPGYETVMHQTVRSAIRNLYSAKEPDCCEDALARYDADTLYHLVAPAVPRLHLLGKMAVSADASYRGNLALSSGELLLPKISFSASPYGLSLSGRLESKGGLTPAADLKLACKNCLTLVDDATGYYNRAAQAYSTLEPNQPLPPLSAETIDGVKQLLSTLAGQTAGQDFTYQIILDKDLAGGSINGKPLSEVSELYETYVTPRDGR